jgi:hypothetical protein
MARVGSPAPVAHVGYWGKTGQHLLVLSFTGFDPQLDMGRVENPAAQ